MTRQQFTIPPRGPFSLTAAARFWGGFTPAAHAGLDAEGHLHMAFAEEGGWRAVGVCVQDRNSDIVGTLYGDADPDVVSRQTARILSLDVDGSEFPAIGRRDPIAAALQRQFPGLRPVCFYSPYEAAVWAILSHRINMRQAATIKARIAEAYGDEISIHGQPMRAFPAPQVLARLTDFPSLPGRKIDSLHAIAHAAMAGQLDAAALRALPDDVALAQLKTLPGIGPFSAELILLRGAGHPDFLTFQEPRFRQAVGGAYGLDHLPTDADLERISDAWRPYRMWVTFLLRQRAAEI